MIEKIFAFAGIALMLMASGCQNNNRDTETTVSSSQQEIIPASIVEFESQEIPLPMLPTESRLPLEPDQNQKLVAFTFDDGFGDYTSSLLLYV